MTSKRNSRTNEQKTERELLVEISSKMDKVVGMLAIAGRNENDQISILKSLNFEWNDIGMLVGMTGNAARLRHRSLNGNSKSAKSKKKTKAATVEVE